MRTASSTQLRWLVLLLATVVLSRIPLLFGGYGADPDAWRVAFVARKFWDSGIYEASRFPGYPLHELASALPISIGGSLASNISTLLCSLAAIIIWVDIAKTHTHHPRLLTVAFAFTPLFWVNSAATMDYAWSLLCILVSYREALNGHSLRSGLTLGFALGFRPSNGIVAIAMVAVLLLRPKPCRNLAGFVAAAGVTTIISFLPVMLTYGVAGWLANIRQQVAAMNETASMHALLFGYRSVYAFGPLAVLAALIIVLPRSRDLLERLKAADPVLVSSLCGVCAILLLFFSLPLERGYLLPLAPFLLLIIDAVASRKAMLVMVLCLVCFGFVNPDVIQHAGIRGTPGFHIRLGIVIEEYKQRRALLNRRKFLSSYRFQENTVVMTGVGPIFWVENRMVEPLPGQRIDDIRDVTVKSLTQKNVLFTPMLVKADLDSLRSAGFGIVCVSDLREYIEKSTGYSMKNEGIRLVNVPNF